MAETEAQELDGPDEDDLTEYVDQLEQRQTDDEEPDDELAPPTVDERLDRARDLLGMARPTEEREEAMDDEDR